MPNLFSILDDVLTLENSDNLADPDVIEAAQRLIDTGVAWTLQGFIGRRCANMIEEGLCHE